MSSLFDKFAFLHHQDSVCVHYCWQSVGDNDNCYFFFLVYCQSLDWLLDHLLAVRVQSWCCLVEYYDLRFSYQRSCNRNSLFLPTTQVGSFLTKHCLKAIGKLSLVVNELQTSCPLACIYQFILSVIIKPISDVIFNGSWKYCRLLIDHSDFLS